MRVSLKSNPKDYTCDSCGTRFEQSLHITFGHSARVTDLCDRCATKLGIQLLRKSRYEVDDI